MKMSRSWGRRKDTNQPYPKATGSGSLRATATFDQLGHIFNAMNAPIGDRLLGPQVYPMSEKEAYAVSRRFFRVGTLRRGDSPKALLMELKRLDSRRWRVVNVVPSGSDVGTFSLYAFPRGAMDVREGGDGHYAGSTATPAEMVKKIKESRGG